MLACSEGNKSDLETQRKVTYEQGVSVKTRTAPLYSRVCLRGGCLCQSITWPVPVREIFRRFDWDRFL